MCGYDVSVHKAPERKPWTDRRNPRRMEEAAEVRHFDKFVDTCDSCKKIVRVGSRTGDRILINPRTVLTYNISIPQINRVISDCVDFGCLCPDCYKKLVEPKIEELEHMDNITDVKVEECK